MAGLEDYAVLLRKQGHIITVQIIGRMEMKAIRMKSAGHILAQWKMACTVGKDVVFRNTVVDLSDIDDDGKYFRSLFFIPSISAYFFRTARMTTTADAFQCEGIGPQSYETIFEVMWYDLNNHLVPLVFSHCVGTECYDTWHTVFINCDSIDCFHVPRRKTIVDQENPVDKALYD